MARSIDAPFTGGLLERVTQHAADDRLFVVAYADAPA